MDTDRLFLRPIQPSDAEDVARVLRTSRDHLAPWIAVPDDPPPGWIEARVAELADAFAAGTRLLFTVRARDGGALVGCVGLTPEAAGELAISYWLAAEHTGRGYGREAIDALCRWACDARPVVRLHIRCAPDNVRSAQLARAAGFVRTAARGDVHVWTATPARLRAWAPLLGACLAAGETVATGDGGALRVDGRLELAVVEVGGEHQIVASADVATAAAFSAADCLRHNATLAIGALCVVDDRLRLRHVCPPGELTPRGLALLLHEAARLSTLAHAVEAARHLEAFAHYAA